MSSPQSIEDIINKYEKPSQFITESVKSDENVQDPLIEDLDTSNISKLLNELSIVSESKCNVSVQIAEIYDEISHLKGKVLGLLHNYQQSLSDKDHSKQLRSQIRKDAKVIHQEYNQIVGRLNESFQNSFQDKQDFRQPEKDQEINNMFNLVEEFLETFQQKKAQRNVYKQMLDSFDMSVRDISSISNSGFTSLNQSKVAETLHEPNVKLVALRSKIQDLLKDQNFSQQIMLEAIDHLSQVLSSESPEFIKKTLDKIEKQVDQLQQGQNSTQLYQLLKEAAEAIQEKQVNISMNSSMASSMASNAPTQIADPGKRRRKFFDEALKIKSQLEPDHPGKKLLVSQLYEQAEMEGISEMQWPAWIQQYVKNLSG